MESESVWLGGARNVILRLAQLSSAITIAVFVIMVFMRMFFGGIGMYELLRPAGGMWAALILYLIAGTIALWSIYLSDIRGVIEIERSGPFDIVSLMCSRLAMIAIIAIEVVMLYEVISRYVFSAPTLWANEMSLWIASFIFLLAGLYAMQQRSHIRIYIIYDMFPRWLKKAADTLSVSLIVLFTFCLVWGSYNEAVLKFSRMEKYGTACNSPDPRNCETCDPDFNHLGDYSGHFESDCGLEQRHNSFPEDDIDQTEIENIRRTLEG